MVSKLSLRSFRASKDKTSAELLTDLVTAISELQQTIRVYKDEVKVVVWTVDKKVLHIKFISGSALSRQRLILKVLYRILKEKKIDANIRETIAIHKVPTAKVVSNVINFTRIAENTTLKCMDIELVVSNNIYM